MEDYTLSTAEFAAKQKIKPESVLARLCRTGTYYGSIPLRLQNGRLMWPARQIFASEATVGGGENHAR